jgi:ATP/maltotriose-dependent transcriptional regulator MalT
MDQSGELIGRGDELERIDAALAGLGDSAAVVTISGEPGIGKTSLLAELTQRADQQGFLVLTGRSAEFEGQLPFSAFVDALDDYLGSLNPRRFTSLEDEQFAELAHLFPSLVSLGASAPSGLQDERYRSHGAVRGLLEALASEKPLVLALDDLHWADDATSELLAHLLRRPPRQPVLLALGFRSGQAPPSLQLALEDLRGDGELAELELGALSAAETDEMLGSDSDLGPSARGELHRLSGGNPFYLEELARYGDPLLGETGTPIEPGEAQVPQPVADALTRELRGLPEESRTVAQGAAVVGGTFDAELAAEAAEIPEAATLAAIDELLERDLLRRTDAPRRFRFRHPIVHTAVYEAARPGWRLAAHARVAAALEGRHASALSRAPHLECSATPGDEAAITVLREAGEAATLRAPASAAHWYAAALRLLPDDEAAHRLGLLIPMAQALGYAGRLEEARRTLDEVLSLLPADQAGVRGQVVASAARLDQLLGRHDAALELLMDALAASDHSGREATELKVQLAGTCFFNGDFDGLRRWVDEALAEADARDDRATRAAATGTLGCAEYMVGDMPAARRRLDEGEALFKDLADEELAGRLHSFVWCGMTEMYLERFDRAAAIFDRAMAVARATGHGHVTTLTRIGQGLVLLWKGQIDEAEDLLDAAIEAARLTGNDQFLTWALWARCWAATLAGDTAKAVRFGERAVASASDVLDPVSAMAGCHLAEARLEADESPAGCRDLILESVGGADMPLVERAFQSRWFELLARAELAAGRVDDAEKWAKRAEAAARGLAISGRGAEALRARAEVALARGDGGSASALALEAGSGAAAAGLPIEEARARLLAGRAFGAIDRKAAIGELEFARETLDRYGAARYRDEAARELRALGERTTRPKRRRDEIGVGVDSLSGREREVAELVAEGHTNKEIAAELYLSEKTIESHLARIFGKLDVSKRAQVAAQIERDREPARS